MKSFFTLLFSFLCFTIVMAQDINPFESIGKEGKIITLSKGKYLEIENNDSLQRIGSVIVDMYTGEIYELLDSDTLYQESDLSPTIITRWWSVDPLSAKYPSMSPYNGFENNPIIFIDPDGREAVGVTDDYKVDRRGNVSLAKKTNKNYDRLIGRDSDGNKTILKTQKGIMNTHMSEQISRTKLVPPDFGDKPVEETFHYTNEIYYGASEPVQNIFEFMANATEVEWAVFRFGSEDNIFPHSVLVTSHADASVGLSWVQSPLFPNSDLVGHDHIHPGGSIDASESDRKFAEGIERMMSGKNITFRIYTKDRGYNSYDSSEREIIITPGQNQE